MEKLHIGPELLSWARLLYKKPMVHLLLNGTLGPPIKPTRGVKQGCPLSCLLFELYLEPLGVMLRTRPDLGIPLDDGSVLAGVFFADDSTLLSGTPAMAEIQAENNVCRFCAESGEAPNRDKCVTLAARWARERNHIELYPHYSIRCGTCAMSLFSDCVIASAFRVSSHAIPHTKPTGTAALDVVSGQTTCIMHIFDARHIARIQCAACCTNSMLHDYAMSWSDDIPLRWPSELEHPALSLTFIV